MQNQKASENPLVETVKNLLKFAKYQHEGSTEFNTLGNRYTYIKYILQHTYSKCTQNINIIILMWKERWILGRITSHDYSSSLLTVVKIGVEH